MEIRWGLLASVHSSRSSSDVFYVALLECPSSGAHSLPAVLAEHFASIPLAHQVGLEWSAFSTPARASARWPIERCNLSAMNEGCRSSVRQVMLERGLSYINRTCWCSFDLLGKKMTWSLWAGLGYILPFVNLHFNWALLGGALY